MTTIKMSKGEYYWRGDGPAFVVESVVTTEGGGASKAELVATTVLVKEARPLRANTQDVPSGWLGPLTENGVTQIEKDQIVRGGRMA